MSDFRTNQNKGSRRSPVYTVIGAIVALLAVFALLAWAESTGTIRLPNGNPQFDSHTGETIEAKPSGSPSNGDSLKESNSAGNQTVRDDSLSCFGPYQPVVEITSPSKDYPYGGYEGLKVQYTILQDGDFWTRVDGNIRFNDVCNILTDEQREELVLNLVDEARRQAGSDLNLVFRDQVITLDLSMMPTRNGMLVPFGESAPGGSVTIDPQIEGSETEGGQNPDFDGTPHSTNPSFGAGCTSEEILDGCTGPAIGGPSQSNTGSGSLNDGDDPNLEHTAPAPASSYREYRQHEIDGYGLNGSSEPAPSLFN